MCLITDRIEPRVAKRDIPVLKIIKKHSKNKFKTPFMRKIYQFNRILDEDDKDIETKDVSYLDPDDGIAIEGGVFHSLFFGYLGFKHEIESELEYRMVRATIPKGSRYWLDKNKYANICSKKLIVSDISADFLYRVKVFLNRLILFI